MSAAGALDSGRYELDRLLGRGGLGEVYLAHDRSLQRDVAVKFVSPDRVTDPAARRALLREARAAAALDHPYICGVYEAGETADGRGFIVMQYVAGPTLASVLQQGPMAVRDALALSADVAEALAVAHRHGVVHRDLKPGNIIVTPGGHPKLVDFGIAKVVVSSATSADASTITGSTGLGAVIGTPAYMSPEQVQGRAVDGRSDLFALGVVLFECLTGRRAFDAPTPVEIAAGILHLHPPAPSTLRAGLSEAHDELCRRLMAKDPADRFQSAEEVVGAIRVLLPDTSHTPSSSRVAVPLPRRRLRTALWAVAAVALTVLGIAAWSWMHPVLPAVPAASDKWYRLGTEAIREGSYETARRALAKAVEIFPRHALAYARLAEVETELDDRQSAQEHLLKLSDIVPNESRLPSAERLRLRAVRAMVLRDVDSAIASYRQLTAMDDSDPGSFVDLGRAQEAAGLRSEARASYEQAVARDPQYASAHLRLGRVDALELRRKEALAAFAAAERLYAASTDVEGETEVLLDRGTALYAFNDLGPARAELERAFAHATDAGLTYQRVRARFALSTVTASEGNYAEAERISTEALRDAEAAGLHTIAAGGLVDLAATLLYAGQKSRAEESLQRALTLARDRGGVYTVARVKAQLAEVSYQNGRPDQALIIGAEVLPFLQQNRFRRLELTVQSILARSHEKLGDLERARTISRDALAMADTLHDDEQASIALTTLALVTTSLGRYPESLQYRKRAEATLRRQGDQSGLPYNLTNQADVLIRLGRPEEADKLLAELDAGIAAGLDSYKGRARRATFLRGFAAATQLRCPDAVPFLERIERVTADDAAASMAPAIDAFCRARLGRRSAPIPLPPVDAEPVTSRERQYWIAAAALQRGAAGAAFAEATRGLKALAGTANDELAWRLSAVAAIAARQLHDTPAAKEMSERARQAYERLRSVYLADFESYQRRPDLAELRKKEQTQ